MGLSDTVVDRFRATVAASTFPDRYVVHREADAGGMGRVYEATESATGRRVALKVLADLGTGHERFTAEVEILERLQHPAIVPYIGHGTTEAGEPYLAMPWLDGESLSKRLARGRLEIVDAIVIARRIAEALAYTHGQGVVHRDVKPSNVFLLGGQAEQATLIDFGVAKDTVAQRGLTHTGQLVGTPGYMAPEQAMGESVIDGRADLFALGCLLYECLVGAPAFDAQDLVVLLARLLNHEPSSVHSQRPEVPLRIDALVTALLVKRPEHRVASAAAVAAELEQIDAALARHDDDALASSELTVAKRPDQHSVRRRLAVIAGTGIAVAIAVATLVITTRSHRTICMAGDTSGCEELCNEGNQQACYVFGAQLVGNGTGMGSDLPRGREILGHLCETHNATACVTLAMSIRQRFAKLPNEAGSAGDWAPWLERGCQDEKSALACLMLAKAYEPQSVPEVHGLPIDRARALSYYERICNLYNDCSDYASHVRNGLGTTADPTRASSILSKACTAGDGRSCRALKAGSASSR